MDVSVIIVNYEVKYYLEQCLASVIKSLIEIKGEIWVVDNASTDQSVEYLEEKFPSVHFIKNEQNVGFSKANNQILDRVSGKLIHFLNPDTIVPEDFYTKALCFFKEHPHAGAMGVKMIDGSGNYLPESKRGIPNYWSSFCKISGIWRLFPHINSFSGYYQGNLSQNESNEVPVLSGASMILTKEAIEKTAGFDERFFMYAEDIDLSIRVKEKGYQVWYYPSIMIIHFKGESTRKNTQNRQVFYETMVEFVKKHEKGTIAGIKAKLLALILPFLVKASQIRSKTYEKVKKRQKSDVKFNIITKVEDLYKLIDKNEYKTPIVLFKEGATLSYRTIIQEMAANKNKVEYFIQGNNTVSIVGSSSQYRNGYSFKEDETKA